MQFDKNKLISYFLDFLIILLVIILLFSIFYNRKSNIDDNNDYGSMLQYTTSDVYDTQNVLGLKFSISPVLTNGSDDFWVEVTVTNLNDYTFALKGFSIVVKNENGEEVGNLHYFENAKLEKDISMRFLVPCESSLLNGNYTLEYFPSYVKGENEL